MANAEYETLDFNIPLEADDYGASSAFVITSIESIIRSAIERHENKIVINTNLRLGLPMENINKIAGPFVQAWAQETFAAVLTDGENEFHLINVEARERLNMADVVLQFQKTHAEQTSLTAQVDVKATAEDIVSSGRSPNITSYARIRTAYVRDPDLIFIVLCLKHKVYSVREPVSELMNGVMEIVAVGVFDLKFISDADSSYNPALGTGQIQIRDISYISSRPRTTWQFCQMLDRKFLASKKGFDAWLELARTGGWIK